MLFIAFRNLFRNKIRNILTIMGVCAGIGICASSLSLGNHVRSQVDGVIERYQIDLIVQTKGSVLPVQSRITQTEFLGITEIAGVGHSSAVVLTNIRTHFDNLFLIMGISETDHFFSRVNILEGRWFEPGKNEIILGKLSSRIHDLQTGNKVMLAHNNMMTITGIYSMGYSMMDSAAIMDINDARKVIASPDAINLILIRVDKDHDIIQVVDTIHNNHPNLYASVSSEMADQLGMINYLEFISLAVSIISVLICCMVVMNTLFMAVSERIREIGVLMSMGWSRIRVGGVIVMEGILISVAGWILGLALSSFFLWWAQGLMSVGPALTPGSLSWEVAMLTLGISVVFGGLGAIIPATYSLRMNPAEAMRHE